MCDCKAFPPGKCPCARQLDELFQAIEMASRYEACDCGKCEPAEGF